MRAHRLDGQPPVSEPGVFVETVAVPVSQVGPAHLFEQVLVAVVVKIGEDDPVSLLQVSHSRPCRHVGKAPARHVAEKQVGYEIGVIHVAGPEVEIGIAVIVDVPEVGPHGLGGTEQVALLADFGKTPLSVAPVEVHPGRLQLVGPIEVRGGHCGDSRGIGCHEQVEGAVVVVVPEPGGETVQGAVYPQLRRHIGEGAVPSVAVQAVGPAQVRHVQVRQAVSVVVPPRPPPW